MPLYLGMLNKFKEMGRFCFAYSDGDFKLENEDLKIKNKEITDKLRELIGEQSVNPMILKLLFSGVSIRRTAILLGINRNTVEKNYPFLPSAAGVFITEKSKN